MKFYEVFFFVSALLFGCSVAQEDLFSSLPSCALDCFQETVGVSSCDPTDILCLCGDQGFMGAAQVCQSTNCTVKEILTSTNATLAACGVPVQDQSATIVGIAAGFGLFAVLLVLLRIIDRLWITSVSLGWDDYLIVLAMIVAGGLNILCFPMAKSGMGRDFWTISFPNLTLTFKLLYAAQIAYMLAEMLVQMSLLAFYLRVFPNNSMFVRTGSWILLGIVTCFGIANTFAMIFQCTPVPFYWNSWSGESKGTCFDINLFSWIRAAIEITIDVLILALPLPSLFKLQMSKKKKVQVLVMFAMGFTITLVSILRLQSLVQFSQTQNPTYDNAPGIYWSVLECDMFIICACMPALRSVLAKFIPSVFGSTTNKSHPSSMGYYRQNDTDGKNSRRATSSHQLNSLSQSGQIVKSINVDVSRQDRSESDEDLMYPSSKHHFSRV